MPYLNDFTIALIPLLAHGGIHSNVTPIEKFVSGIGFFVISLALMSLIFKRHDLPAQKNTLDLSDIFEQNENPTSPENNAEGDKRLS